MMCTNGKPGAVEGKHNVLVRVGRGGQSGIDEMDAPPERRAASRPVLPAEYLSAAKTPIKIEVTADKHSYEINVRSSSAASQQDSQKDKE